MTTKVNKKLVNYSGELLLLTFIMYISFGFIFFTPFDIYTDRDLELNAKSTIGETRDFFFSKAKNGKEFRQVKIEYFVNEKKYSIWLNDEKLELFKKVELVYAPFYPQKAIFKTNKELRKPWQEGVFLRLLILETFGIICISISFYKLKDIIKKLKIRS